MAPGEEPDATLRDEGGVQGTARGAARAAGDLLDTALRQREGAAAATGSIARKTQTLDDWLAEDDTKRKDEQEDEYEYEEEDEEEESEYETETEEEESDGSSDSGLR